MPFNPSAVKNVDQSTLEEEILTFPFIQYNNGNPQMKQLGGMSYMGGWFAAEDRFFEDLTKRGWERIQWVRGDDGETNGYWSRDIEIAVIHTRHRWEVYQGKGKPRLSFAWNEFNTAKTQGNPSGRLQVLGLVRGLEDIGAVMLTLRGYASMGFEGSMRTPGAMGMFKNTVIQAADLASRRAGVEGKWPKFAFWMKVGPDRDWGKKDHPPVFTKVGSGTQSSVALIKLIGVPEKIAEVDLDKYYVGDDVREQAEKIYHETKEWAEAWDRPSNSPEGENKAKADEQIEDMGEEALPWG